jgi:predicted secreted acid phosphatase
MHPLRRFRHAPRSLVAGLVIGLVLGTTGVVAAANLAGPKIITPITEHQVTNLDVLRLELKNYYGTPGAATGSGSSAGWTLALDTNSNYADEARKVATAGKHWLDGQALSKKPSGMKAIVLDVDDTTLTTWDYELYSNWDYNPTSNQVFVGLTDIDPTPAVDLQFTGNLFPATPGMVAMVQHAKDLGYAIFFITGRGDVQHQATIANLQDDAAAGEPTTNTVSLNGATLPEQDAGYAAPTPVETGHGAAFNGGTPFTDGLFTKPALGDYPAYLDKPQFCATAIANHASCATVQYKSGTRAYIESLGYTIVANFGDQFSDLQGGFATKTFKMPNPNYYLP